MRLFTIDLIILFAGLPGIVIYDSATRLKRFGWEWIMPILMIISVWAVILDEYFFRP